MTTVSIKYCDIPAYLHAGEFYRNLDYEDPEGIIEVPADCFAPEGRTVLNLSELSQLLKTFAFWMLDDIPLGVLDFCRLNDVELWRDTVVKWPGAEVDVDVVSSALLLAYSSAGTLGFEKVVATGRWDLIKHATFHQSKTGSATAIAVKAGDLRLLRHLYNEGFELTPNTCTLASAYGNLDCMQFARESGGLWNTKVPEVAARNGHIDCLAFAHENGCPWDCETVIAATQAGQEECLKYALAHHCPVDAQAFDVASKSGHRGCLNILRDHRAPWSTNTPVGAAEHKDAECMKFLHENNCPWDDLTSTQCARKGKIATLRYALDNGCPRSELLLQDAAGSGSGGSLKCLQYLIEEQLLHMDESVFLRALLKGDLACVQYLIDVGCPYRGAQFTEAMGTMGIRNTLLGMLPCIEYAVERGWEPNAYFVKFVSSRNQKCKEWFAGQGLQVDQEEFVMPNRIITYRPTRTSSDPPESNAGSKYTHR